MNKQLPVSRKQVDLLMRLMGERDAAQDRVNLVFVAVVGAHDLADVPVLEVDPVGLTVTVEVPDEDDEPDEPQEETE